VKRVDHVAIELPDRTYDLLMRASQGRLVTARMMLEEMLKRAIVEERNAREAAHRAEVARQRRRFGWAW
jgi:hypothetical protein